MKFTWLKHSVFCYGLAVFKAANLRPDIVAPFVTIEVKLVPIIVMIWLIMHGLFSM